MTFEGKSVSVFVGIPMVPQKTLELFSKKCFVNFFVRSWKRTFVSFHDFGYTNLLILFNNVMYNCKAKNNNGNEWLLLDVNPTTMFLDVKKKCIFSNVLKKKSCGLWL